MEVLCKGVGEPQILRWWKWTRLSEKAGILRNISTIEEIGTGEDTCKKKDAIENGSTPRGQCTRRLELVEQQRVVQWKCVEQPYQYKADLNNCHETNRLNFPLTLTLPTKHLDFVTAPGRSATDWYIRMKSTACNVDWKEIAVLNVDYRRKWLKPRAPRLRRPRPSRHRYLSSMVQLVLHTKWEICFKIKILKNNGNGEYFEVSNCPCRGAHFPETFTK